jgi:hypothetical protein
MVEGSAIFCITTWLPRCRTFWKPFRARMSQTSRPEKTRSLPNLDLELGYKNLRMLPSFNLRRVCSFQEKLYSLL